MRMNLLKKRVCQALHPVLAALLLLTAQSQPAWSCAVCFGQGNSELSRGFFWGSLFLLVLPVIAFTTILYKIVSATRKKSSAATQ